MGVNRSLQFSCLLSIGALAACLAPTAEVTGDGSTGSAANSSSGGGSAGSGGGTGGSTGGTGTTGGGSGTTGGAADAGMDAGALGQPCMLDPSVPDPCFIYGLVCHYVGPGSRACQLPGEGEHCLPEVGCSWSLDQCVTEAGPRCMHACQDNFDCQRLFESCQTLGAHQVCIFDSCPPNTGGTLAACDAGGAESGTCLFPSGCLAGGTAAAGEPCTGQRFPSTTASHLCGFGLICDHPYQPGGARCAPICGLGDAGPACASPTSCMESWWTSNWGTCG